MRPRRRLALLPLAILAAGCATGGVTPVNAGDRVIVTTQDGTVIRQAASGDAHVSFAAPLAATWGAVQAAYVDVGLDANTSDPSTGRYGVMRYAMPRRLKGVPMSTYFGCGSNMTGPIVSQGRVTADVLTTLVASGDGSTNGTIAVNAVVRKDEGTSGDVVVCTTTGRLEEELRTAIQRHLATP